MILADRFAIEFKANLLEALQRIVLLPPGEK